MSLPTATGQVAWKRVTERHERTATAGIVRVTMEDALGQRETLTVTQNHPYLRAANDNGPGILNAVRLDPGGDWSAAGLLRPGDRVQSGKGAHLEVISVEPVEGAAAKVYNFEVADHHTYAVGELEAWAHNAGSWPRTPEGAPSGWGRPTITPNGSGFGSKYQWTLSCGCKITFENHGQHRDAPLFHRGTHWHVECAWLEEPEALSSGPTYVGQMVALMAIGKGKSIVTIDQISGSEVWVSVEGVGRHDRIISISVAACADWSFSLDHANLRRLACVLRSAVVNPRAAASYRDRQMPHLWTAQTREDGEVRVDVYGASMLVSFWRPVARVERLLLSRQGVEQVLSLLA